MLAQESRGLLAHGMHSSQIQNILIILTQGFLFQEQEVDRMAYYNGTLQTCTVSSVQ